MNKISNEQISQVLHEAPGMIRSLVAENSMLRTKVASMERHDAAEKLAEAMHAKGLDLDKTAEELTERLEKAAAQGKLDTIREAVDMVGPDMSEKIGSIANNDVQVAMGSDFERFLVGGVG
jgi:hypothetical protein